MSDETKMDQSPLIIYVDDEPNNLTVFEASLPEEWRVRTFDNPATVLSRLDELKPWVIVSDQRMPLMKGVEFLELCRKLYPDAVRMIVTGFSEEDLIIDSVRKAQVFDYIRKPWDLNDLQKSLERAIDFHRVTAEKERLLRELKAQKDALQAKAQELSNLAAALEESSKREKSMIAELECWVPPFVLWTLRDAKARFPMTRDLVGITFDIIGSSRIHGQDVDGKPLRARVIELFSEAIMRNGGWRESHSGDSAYAHFGLLESNQDPFESALAAAREFRVMLRSLSKTRGFEIECGIALHLAQAAVVDVHTVQINTPRGIISQKSFDTTSTEIDLLHRMEKLVHDLPGTNIVMSEAFVTGLKHPPEKLVDLGALRLKGQAAATRLFLFASDRVGAEDLQRFKAQLEKDGEAVPLVLGAA